ncbi:MAG: inositol monophosphatase family protein [Planctomycetota bacterium]
MAEEFVARSDLAERLRFARHAAIEIGDGTLDLFFDRSFGVDRKADGSVVTEADRNAEKRFRELVSEAYPDDGVLGEEFGETAGNSGMRWIVDPIDGTASFVAGVPLYGSLVALECQGRSLVGVIHMPALAETVFAADGLGATHVTHGGRDEVVARVSDVERLADSTLCVTSLDYFRASGKAGLFETLCGSARQSRGWSDCYALLLVATGRIEAAIEPGLHPWDIAPLDVILREAGGRLTDWTGNGGALIENAVASNGRVHDELLAIVKP